MRLAAMVRRCALPLFFVAIVQGGWPVLSVAQSGRTSEQQKEHVAPRPGKETAAPDKQVPSAALPAGSPAAPEPQAAPGQVGELQPVLHAQGAKISTCMDTIVGESAAVIDSAHTAISSWNAAAPDENLFVSIVGLSYANKVAPNGAAVLLAAPTGTGK